MLSGIDSVVVAVVLFQNYSGGEFGRIFCIYDIFAKGASFLGSVVIAVVKLAGGTINVAVACLAVFFALGFVFLKIADHQRWRVKNKRYIV